MRPAVLDLDLYQGDPFTLPIQFRSEDVAGVVTDMDLSGVVEVRSQIRVSAVDTTVLTTVSCVIDSASQGRITISLTSGQVTALPRICVWDLEFAYVSGSNRTWIQGGVQVQREVTHA